MIVLGSFIVLACIEGGVFGDVLAHTISGLDQVVTQVTITGLGQAASLGLKVAGVSAGSPEASDLGDGIFSIMEIARAIALALTVPLGAPQEALNAANLGSDTAREDGPDARDGGQLRDVGIGSDFGGDPAVDLFDLSFEEADVIEGEVEDALDRQSQGRVEQETLLGYLVELAGVVESIGEVVAAEMLEMESQVLDR